MNLIKSDSEKTNPEFTSLELYPKRIALKDHGSYDPSVAA